MVHQREGLALGVEARDHRARVHALLDDLQRHAPLDRFGLLGQEDVTHAALSQATDQVIDPDHRADILVRARAALGATERKRAVVVGTNGQGAVVVLHEGGLLGSVREAVNRMIMDVILDERSGGGKGCCAGASMAKSGRNGRLWVAKHQQ